MARGIEVGTRVYYTGDMANQPHWAEIVEIRTGRGQEVTLRADARDESPRTYTIPRHHIGDVYAGHCDPRFVTEAAWLAYRAERFAGA